MAKLLSSLPVGTKVKFGKYSVNGETAQPIIWLIVAKNHTSYPANSVTLLTEKAIDIRAFDAAEPNNTDTNVKENGNSYYPLSNIDQWLNKSASNWYSPTHSYDQAPTSGYTGNYGTGYDTRPGFLNAFSTYEINAILDSTIVTPKLVDTVSTKENIIRKVFAPSTTEIGFSENYWGACWEYFVSNSKVCPLTQQAYTHSLSTTKPGTVGDNIPYWTRNYQGSTSYLVKVSDESSTAASWRANAGRVGVRPALNLSNTLMTSDAMDSDGCYSVILNSPPPSPTTITTPSKVYGGKSNAISWSAVTDPNGDTVTYQLECSLNGGNYTQIYSGQSTSYAHLISFGTNNVTYRVRAIDSFGESSAYKTTSTISVINNTPPVISGKDENLGVKSNGFTGTYTITDVDGNAVTVTESIDGVQIRSLVATLGATITYGITETTWLALANGSHTLTIRATDGVDTSVRTYTFTKLVDSFTIQNTTPLEAATMPSRIMLVVTKNVPSAATFKVEVCNNGYDGSPTWEDATDAVVNGLVHVFTNKSKSSTKWGVRIKVTVKRNGATGACYVSTIGGNFE